MDNNDLRQDVFDDIIKLAVENKFSSLEKPKQIHLVFDQWTPETDILTPTMKMKRNIAQKVYEKEIEKMYEIEPMKVSKK